MRTFEEWYNSIPDEIKERIISDEKPLLNMINYFIITNIMTGKLEVNPTVEEIFHWIITEQIDARRK